MAPIRKSRPAGGQLARRHAIEPGAEARRGTLSPRAARIARATGTVLAIAAAGAATAAVVLLLL